MPKYTRSETDLKDALEEQRVFLRNSCIAYDSGVVSEAKRIATTVCTLCHDGGKNSRSILGQLGLKDTSDFISSAITLSPRQAPRTRLASAMYFEQGWIFVPNFLSKGDEEVRDRLRFKKWYNEVIMEPVVIDASIRPPDRKLCLSRMNLIFHLRSQDGGSHLDGEVASDAYINFGLRNFTGFGYKVAGEDEPYPVPYPHLASMRQIAFEIEEMLSSVLGGLALPEPESFDLIRSNMATAAGNALARLQKGRLA